MNLKRYMVLLASGTDEMSDFVASPQKAADRAGLSPDDQKILFSGDQNRIYAALASASSDATQASERAKPGEDDHV